MRFDPYNDRCRRHVAYARGKRAGVEPTIVFLHLWYYPTLSWRLATLCDAVLDWMKQSSD